jgi:hypothetical protein
MTPRLRWLAATCLMVLWLTWLGWQAYGRPNPVIVSRPQVDRAPLLIIATLPAPLPARLILDDWEVVRGPERKPDRPLTVLHLDRVQGWRGPGSYLLPLEPAPGAGVAWQVAPVPITPGYSPPGPELERRIYPDKPGVRAQLTQPR